MASKEDFTLLIEVIKKATGRNQFEISIDAGYKEKYISEAVSKGNITDKLMRSVMTVLVTDGDVEDYWKEVVKNNQFNAKLAVDLLKAPHHGRDDYNQNSIDPDYIIRKNPILEANSKPRGIPFYEAPIKAGIEPMYRDEKITGPDFYMDIPQYRDCDYGCRASGDSMYPEIRNGDMIICKEITHINGIVFGEIYVIQTSSGIETVKYLHPHPKNPDKFLLKARNESIPPTPINKEDVLKIYKVRGVFKGM